MGLDDTVQAGILRREGFIQAIADIEIDVGLDRKLWAAKAKEMLTESVPFWDVHAKDYPNNQIQLEMNKPSIGDPWGKGYVRALRLIASGHTPPRIRQ